MVKFHFSHNMKILCGLDLKKLGPENRAISSGNWFFHLTNKLPYNYCSCCDNKIVSLLRQRMLGIK